MMNKHWSFISTCLVVIIIIYVGTAASLISDTCTSDNVKESTGVTINVKAKEWVPGGPKISVEIVAKSSIKDIEIWAESTNNNSHIGSWSLMPGYKFTDCGIGMSTIASIDDLKLSQITFEWNPPRVEGQNQLIPSQGTPSETTPTPTATPSSTDKRSLIARQEAAEGSTPSYGPIVFKGVIQFEDGSEIHSFKSDNFPVTNDTAKIPIPKTNATNATNNSNNSNGTQNNGSNIDNKYPKNPTSSAANSKFLFRGFNLLFILSLSVILVAFINV